jgi:hypothetical protein
VTLDELRTWALGHGFAAAGPSTVAAPYRDATVSLTFLRRDVRVEIAGTQGRIPIGTFRINNGIAHINEHDVVEGIGISASFLSAFVGYDGPKPIWMTDAYFESATKNSLPAP